MNRIMKVKDVIANTEMVDDHTDIWIYGHKSRIICYGNWYQDDILDQFDKEVIEVDYLLKENKCWITIKDRKGE